MPIYTTALLHDYQPPRRLCDVIYQPLRKEIDQTLLIPEPNGNIPANYNQNILEESYAPRAFSDLYSKVGFNVGPTLLSWMLDNDRNVARKIIESDKVSQDKFEGHGNAIAQASWNHAILPLTAEKHPKDLSIQIKLGIKCFQEAFGRYPEGVWLPETAVSYKVLEALSDHRIKFVILSPFQASKIKPINEGSWWDVSGGRIDPSRAYKIFIPNTFKSINAFFYDKEIAPDISFPRERNSKIFHSSGEFINRIKNGADWKRQHEQLIHYAADGETFGHHHKNVVGVVAQAYDLINSHAVDGLELTNYGLFLEKNPPAWEAQIFDNSAWSCGHGLGRWGEEKNGLCNCGGVINSDWRIQLRQAFDYLKENIDRVFEEKGKHYLYNPWEARNDYISVSLGAKSFDQFIETHAKKGLNKDDLKKIHKLLEMEKFSMLMYTSCAWFHGGLGIEAYTSLISANSAVGLLKDLTNDNKVEEEFIKKLSFVQFGDHDAFNNYKKAGELVQSGSKLIRAK